MAEQGSLIGQKVDPYLIQELLGTGGMGAVYRAQDLRLGRAVAIKIITLSQGSKPGFAARFQREAHLLAHLDHPNILPLWDVGQAGNLLYLVTPVVEGGSLRDLRLRLGGSVPVARALLLAVQVADALEHAHRRGVVHRDVKPGNLLLHTDGRVMLADFGIARSVNERPDVSATDLAIGTPHYVSPEQALGDQVDGRADIYSLGAVLYELLSGRTPYVAESTTRVLVQMLDGPPPPLRQVNPWVSPEVQAVIMRAVASQPGERYATATEFSAALRKLLTDGTLFANSSQQKEAQSSAVPAVPTPRVSVHLPPAARSVGAPAAPPPADQRRTRVLAPEVPAQQERGPWKLVASEPPSSSRSTYIALAVTGLVILFLIAVFVGALVINR